MPNLRETVPILLCCNRQYAQHMTVCIVSLLENNRDLQFEITALVTFTDNAVFNKILASVNLYHNASLRFVHFQVPTDVRLDSPYYPPDILARLWVADIIDPRIYPRAVYLDADMVVLSEIAEMWHTDLEGKIFGAVSIPGSTRAADLDVPEQYGYFNSGLLLIDVVRWAAANAKDRTLEILRNPRIFLGTPEQDALNMVFYDQRKALDYVWNVISPFFWNNTFIPFDEDRKRRICREAKILHFNGRSKPWSYMSRHPRRIEYFRYLERTEWRDYRPPDRTPLNMFKKHAGVFVPDRLGRWLRGGTPGST